MDFWDATKDIKKKKLKKGILGHKYTAMMTCFGSFVRMTYLSNKILELNSIDKYTSIKAFD